MSLVSVGSQSIDVDLYDACNGFNDGDVFTASRGTPDRFQCWSISPLTGSISNVSNTFTPFNNSVSTICCLSGSAIGLAFSANDSNCYLIDFYHAIPDDHRTSVRNALPTLGINKGQQSLGVGSLKAVATLRTSTGIGFQVYNPVNNTVSIVSLADSITTFVRKSDGSNAFFAGSDQGRIYEYDANLNLVTTLTLPNNPYITGLYESKGHIYVLTTSNKYSVFWDSLTIESCTPFAHNLTTNYISLANNRVATNSSVIGFNGGYLAEVDTSYSPPKISSTLSLAASPVLTTGIQTGNPSGGTPYYMCWAVTSNSTLYSFKLQYRLTSQITVSIDKNSARRISIIDPGIGKAYVESDLNVVSGSKIYTGSGNKIDLVMYKNGQSKRGTVHIY